MNTYSVVLMGQQNNNMIITEYSREQNLPSGPLGKNKTPHFDNFSHIQPFLERSV